MDQAYIGAVMPWAGTYAPMGWTYCWGQQMSIAQNQALYAVIGMTYGGDGRNYFNLPDLRGKVVVGTGGNGVANNYTLGSQGGQETVLLNANQLPSHTHNIPASSAPGDQSVPGVDMCFAQAMDSDGNTVNGYTSTQNTQLMTKGLLGTTQAHENRQPFLTLNYIICVQGLFPPRE